MHPIVELARKTVELYVREGEVPVEPEVGLDGLPVRAGVFVSIKKHGQLRGCIGTIEATRPTLASEVIHNAVSASTRDPRFRPVQPDELGELEYSVDILGAAEEVSDISELDPKRFGVIVSKGRRRGLLLPDLEGVDTVEEQLRIASMKAGIDTAEAGIGVERFEVVRYR